MKYVCLLRGINVGGNNKVSMSQLRVCFEAVGFTNVSTYLNSGNVIFETQKTSEKSLIDQCQREFQKSFGFEVVMTVVSKDNFLDAVMHAPQWWGIGDKEQQRSDALFVIPPKTPSQVRAEIKVKPGSPDRFAEHGPVLFWSLPMADYNKSVVPKIIGTPIYKFITIRSSTTIRKLVEMLEG